MNPKNKNAPPPSDIPPELEVFPLASTLGESVDVRYVSTDIAPNNETDPTTGLVTKDVLNRELDTLIESGNQHFGVIFIDLGNFKGVNDELGHVYGDLILQKSTEVILQKAKELLQTITRKPKQDRSKDLIAHETLINSTKLLASRYGGDEFAILVDLNPSDEESTNQFATDEDRIAIVEDRIRAGFTEMIDSEADNLKGVVLSASIGSTVFKKGMTTQQLLKNADLAMMTDKVNHRIELWQALPEDEKKEVKAFVLNPVVQAGLKKLGLRPPEVPIDE